MATSALILKQGYLKKLPNQTRIGSSLKRADRRWITFGLTREQQPYLAFYTNEEAVTTAAPLKAIPLRTCCHITKSLNLKGHTNVFTLTLADRKLSLMAPSMADMDGWCRVLDTTLKSLGILQPDENLYTVQATSDRSPPSPDQAPRRFSAPLPHPPPPTSSTSSSSLRDPTSPLPPAPRRDLPPVPNPTSAAAPDTFLAPHDGGEMSQQSSMELAAASGETYEPLWSGPAGGGLHAGVTAQRGGAPAASTTTSAASGASSPPGVLPPPIPRRTSRLGMGSDSPGTASNTTSRPRPSSSRASAASPAGDSTGRVQAETDYGCIWTEDLSYNSPAGRGQTQAQRDQNGIAPPRYTERDEAPAASLSFTGGSPSRPTTLAQNTPNPLPVTSRTASNLHQTSPGLQVSRPAGSGLSAPSSGGRIPLSPGLSSTAAPPYTPHAASVGPAVGVGGAMGYSFSPAPHGPNAAPSPSSPLNVLPSKMMEALGISESSGNNPEVCGWNAPPLDDHDAPPPYMPRGMPNRGQLKSLKQTQVESLENEMNHAGGVKVTLRKVDCHLTIAWVDCNGSTWIAGWNQKARPFLHNAFHVGDQIVSINGQVVESGRMAHKLIKHSDDQAKITFILKRVPCARVFALKRAEDGEDLGLRREGGTAEIIEVVPYGVAARHSIPARAPTMDKRSLCNWFITEINMRPINLFFKEDEVEKRLNAVGRDISILIQPVDFINELKLQLKKNLKNYKDFVVQ